MQKTNPRLRFVVQEHHEGGGVHWDLMLHRPDDSANSEDQDYRILATWRLGIFPIPCPLSDPVPLTSLPDHRRAYLTYEGSISGGRGWCRIVDRGEYELLDYRADLFRVCFGGHLLVGSFILKKIQEPDRWVLANP